MNEFPTEESCKNHVYKLNGLMALLAIETVLNKNEKLTIGRAYGRVIDDYSTESFKPFFNSK